MSAEEETTVWEKLREAFRNIQNYILSNSPPSSSSATAEDVPHYQVRVINEDVCEIYAPKDDDISVEVVFVHGLQQKASDHPHITTWLTRNQPVELWPKTWLGESQFKQARILSVSYGTLNLYREAENLLSTLITNAKVGQRWHCPVVMVGHCLGGLLIKKLCVFLSNSSSYNEYAEKFVGNVRGVFFFATPHLGISFDVNGIASSPLWKESEILNGEMARLNSDFERLRTQKKWGIGAVGESNQTRISESGNLMSFQHGIMVPEASARHCTDVFYTASVGHFDVCKPINKTDSTFQALVDFVQHHIGQDEARYSTEYGLLADLVIVGLQASVDIVVEELDEAQRLGIVGMPGIGKTTLAMGVFDKISRRFEYACFLYKVKDMMADDVSADDLRAKIAGKLTHRGDDVESSFKWKKLKGKKVLIILDDAKFESQVRVMTKSDGFSKDSRVIVTSRNSEFLRPKNFKIHNARALRDDDSKKLLCLHAFKKPGAPRSHEEHVIRLVKKCGGLPLALTVSGNYLYNREVPVWDDALDKLSRTQPLNGSLEDGLWSILSWSYDSLAPSEQEMFLDVATCFCGEELEEVQEAWRMCSWASTAVESGWQNLLDRCLVCEKYGRISMHEMLRDLGREKGSHSRMVGYTIQEANQLLHKEEMATLLKVLIIDYYFNFRGYIHDHLVHMDGLKLYGLEKLEILWLSNVRKVSLSLGELPALQQLKIDYCGFMEFSESIGELRALRSLEITSCHSLEALPNTLGLLHNLEHLTIAGCGALKALPNTLGLLHNLEHLKILECGSLTELPKSVGQLRALRHLEIRDCDDLNTLPESLGQPKALKQLIIKSCKRLRMLPQSIGHLRPLQHLEISRCTSLTALLNNVGELQALEKLKLDHCDELRVLPESIGQLRALRHLEIDHCTSLIALPNNLETLQTLEQLKIVYCSILRVLPESIGQLQALRHLDIGDCFFLDALPETLGQLQALEQLRIVRCSSLRVLPESIGQLQALWHLDIGDCRFVDALPKTLGQLQALEQLKIVRSSVRVLPTSFGQLQALWHLEIRECPYLDTLPETLGQLQALEQLTIKSCLGLTVLPESIGHLGALRHLEIGECLYLDTLPETLGQLQALEQLTIKSCLGLTVLPESIGHLGALRHLEIGECPYLVTLPETLGQLQALKQLKIKSCRRLTVLPESIGHLGALRHLEITDCRSLRALPKTPEGSCILLFW